MKEIMLRRINLWLCKSPSYDPIYILKTFIDCSRRIESMKMETVIRSPQKGTVSKLVHKSGVCNLLLLFELILTMVNRIFARLAPCSFCLR